MFAAAVAALALPALAKRNGVEDLHSGGLAGGVVAAPEGMRAPLPADANLGWLHVDKSDDASVHVPERKKSQDLRLHPDSDFVHALSVAARRLADTGAAEDAAAAAGAGAAPEDPSAGTEQPVEQQSQPQESTPNPAAQEAPAPPSVPETPPSVPETPPVPESPPAMNNSDPTPPPPEPGEEEPFTIQGGGVRYSSPLMSLSLT